MKFVGSIEFEIWTIVCKNNVKEVVIAYSMFIKIKLKSTKEDIPNFILIEYKRAEVQRK